MRLALPASCLLLSLAVLVAPGCATGGADPTASLQNPEVVTRTEPNGDVITEYRVGGQLQMVKVAPSRGPTYYLIDRDGDGRPDNKGPVSPVYWKLFEWN